MRFAIVVLCACVLAACSRGEQSTTSSSSTAPVAATMAATVAPSDAASPLAAATAAASGAVVAATTPAASPLPSVAFTDVTGVQGQADIVRLAQLGVLDATSGPFHPGDPVKRRDFVRWLFKTNNAVWSDQTSRQIHLADATDKSDFSDITPNDPDFRYIEGMSEAGIAVGFPDKTFRPDQPLTREQMLAIKAGLDRGGVSASYVKDPGQARFELPAWKDKDQISKTYVAAIMTDISDERTDAPKVDNIGRTFGAISMLRPQQNVTRAQAAVIMNVIGAHDPSVYYDKAPRSVAAALNPSPKPSP